MATIANLSYGGYTATLSAGHVSYDDLAVVFPQLVDVYGDRGADFVKDVRRAADHLRNHASLERLDSVLDFGTVPEESRLERVVEGGN